GFDDREKCGEVLGHELLLTKEVSERNRCRILSDGRPKKYGRRRREGFRLPSIRDPVQRRPPSSSFLRMQESMPNKARSTESRLSRRRPSAAAPSPNPLPQGERAFVRRPASTLSAAVNHLDLSDTRRRAPTLRRHPGE